MASSGAEEFGVGVSTAPPAASDDAGPAASREDSPAGVADARVSQPCPNCGTALAGDFCHGCGEKRPEARDLSVRHFFGEAARELTSVEHSKLFHTVWALLFRPGLLTNEWAAGRRKRYLKPLNLCLGVPALSLFAYSFYKPVSMFDVEKFIKQDRRGETMQLFERLAAKKQMGTAELFERIGERRQRYMSLSPLLFVGLFALVLQVVFVFSRRYFVEHLVFAMHFVSFSTLAVVLLWPLYFFIGIKQGGVNAFVAVFKWLLDIVYMFFAVRAVYAVGTARTLAASVLLTLGYFLSYMLVLGGALAAALVTVIAS